MLTQSQLHDIEKAMAEEHRKDREALERLKRFLKSGNGNSAIDTLIVTHHDDDHVENGQTIIGKITSVIEADPSRKWTVPGMLVHLRNEGFPLLARKPEATLGLVFQKLQRRGKIKRVRQGAGRMPSIYRGVPKQEEETQTATIEIERAAS